MSMFRRRVVFASITASLAFSASNVFAAADPNAPPPNPDGTVTTQDPNAQPQGQVVMQGNVAVGQQPQPQPQPPQQQQQQPGEDEPPPRRSLLIGASPTFHIPLIGSYATGGAYGGGLNVQVGYGFGNLSIAFSPGIFYYRGRNGLDDVAFSLGAIIRYTFLRDVIIHPFIEVGVDYWGYLDYSPRISGRTFGIGASGVIGAEYDVTDHISLQLAARITGVAGDTGTSSGWNGDLMLTPFVAFAYYR